MRKKTRRRFLFAIFVLLSLAGLFIWSQSTDRGLFDVDAKARYLADEYGRQIILRGANAGGRSKLPPFFSFESEPDFDAGLKKYVDALDSLGLNAVRLLIMYEAAEPERGAYDEAYLANYDKMVDAFAARGFKIIVDSHQDVFSRRFCGDGFPDWVMPEKYRDRPQRSDCKFWELSYLSPGVNASFDRLWSNEDGVLDRYVEFFGMLAERYRDNPAVIGFEPVNEPYPGGWGILHYKRWHEERLYPFYEKVGRAVHAADPRFLIFADISPVENPGLWKMKCRRPDVKNLVLAPHYYDMGYMKFGPFNLGGGLDAMRIGLRKHFRVANQWDVPVFIGEYGVSMHRDDAAQYLTRLYSAFDELNLSGTIWEASMSPTLWNMRDKAILDPDGTPREAIYSIVRPYPRAVAGTIDSFSFNPETGVFKMEWTENPDIKQPTEIYLPERIFTGGPEIEIAPDGNYRINSNLQILSIASLGSGLKRSLKISIIR